MAIADQPAAAAPQRGRPQAKHIIRTKGWQAAGIDENAAERGFVPLTEFEDSAVILNCYTPGQADEMHCHPKEDHVFLVWKGRLHLTGVEDGEELTLGPGQFVHIVANYYYRLHNPGPDTAVYCQFRTLPKKHPKRRNIPFVESARGKRAAAAASANGGAD
jgi:quercetin dioxygenase-like cupin family protein